MSKSDKKNVDKKQLSNIILFTFLLIISIGVVMLKQHKKSQKSQTTNSAIPGSYTKIDTTLPGLDKVVQESLPLIQAKNKRIQKLVKIHKASTQIVAGLNYRLTLEYQTSDNPQENELVEVTIYKDLKGKLSITSYKKIKNE